MSYFEQMSVKNTDNEVVNPATEDGIRILRRILNLLKPLGIVAGTTNRLQVEPVQATPANLTATVSIAATQTLATVTTVTTVNSVTNMANVGNIPAFDLMKATSRAAYANSVRQNLSFS